MGNHRSEDFFYPGNAVHGAPDYGPMPWRKSMCLEQSLTNAPSYSATKAFQINYTKSLQKRTKDNGITITEIRPGLIL